MQNALITSNLSFGYENSTEPIFDNISLQIHNGWTGIVGPNGSGKTTLVKLLTGDLSPTNGSVSFDGNAVYCEQRTDDLPPDYDILFHTNEKEIFRIKNMLGIVDDWPERWSTLSHGERKRLQIAVALAKFPAVLAVDEPTNHLDHEAKNVLYNALRTYSGIGLLISHDRELLDGLCGHTLFTTPPTIELYKCAYTVASEERERGAQFIRKEREKASREVKRIQRRVKQQSVKAGQADKLRSKRDMAPKDHDAKSKMDIARLTGKDAIEGRIYNRLQSRLAKEQERMDGYRVKKVHAGGIRIDAGAHGYRFPLYVSETVLALNDSISLHVPELVIGQGARIGIVGPNGSGKSTFVRHLIGQQILPREQFIYIPQEIDRVESIALLDWVKKLDNREKGSLLTILRRLGSDPDRVLESELPSPGEVRKLMLARGMMNGPALIIMDEPTNHMDLFSMQHIEQALVDCGCALLLVSHDFVFLQNIVEYLWSFEQNEKDFRIIGRYPEND